MLIWDPNGVLPYTVTPYAEQEWFNVMTAMSEDLHNIYEELYPIALQEQENDMKVARYLGVWENKVLAIVNDRNADIFEKTASFQDNLLEEFMEIVLNIDAFICDF